MEPKNHKEYKYYELSDKHINMVSDYWEDIVNILEEKKNRDKIKKRSDIISSVLSKK